MIKQYLLVALGGALGAMARFGVGHLAVLVLGRGFPYATLCVNVAGSFVIGVLYVWIGERAPPGAVEWRAFLMVGVLGAFTTFSSFSLETLQLYSAGLPLRALLNVVLNLMLCVLGCALGQPGCAEPEGAQAGRHDGAARRRQPPRVKLRAPCCPVIRPCSIRNSCVTTRRRRCRPAAAGWCSTPRRSAASKRAQGAASRDEPAGRTQPTLESDRAGQGAW